MCWKLPSPYFLSLFHGANSCPSVWSHYCFSMVLINIIYSLAIELCKNWFYFLLRKCKIKNEKQIILLYFKTIFQISMFLIFPWNVLESIGYYIKILPNSTFAIIFIVSYFTWVERFKYPSQNYFYIFSFDFPPIFFLFGQTKLWKPWWDVVFPPQKPPTIFPR